MKLIGKALLLAVCLSSVSHASVFVSGKAPLTLGQDTARLEAIKNALVDASYRKNAYVSAKTEIKDLEIEESSSIIKTSTVIKDYTVTSESECGMFYCVDIKVEYGEKPKTTDDIDGTSVYLTFNTSESYGVELLALNESLTKSVISQIGGTRGVGIVENNSISDYVINVSFKFSKADLGIFSFALDPKLIVQVDVEVTSALSSISKTFELNEYLSHENELSSLDRGAEQIKSEIISLINQLPTENNFLVSNVEGNRIFLKSTEQTIGSYYQVVFDDLKTGDEVAVVGVVKSVYLDDVIIELEQVPPATYRLKRLSKLTQ